jgi:hypothetical protein
MICKPLRLQPAVLIGDGRRPYRTCFQLAILIHRPRALGSRWVAWAQTVAARYGTRAAWYKPVGMLLARLKTRFTRLREVVHRRSITLAPRTELKLMTLNHRLAWERAPRWTPMLALGSRDGRSAGLRTFVTLDARRPTNERALAHLLMRQEPQGVHTEVSVRRFLARGERLEGFGYPGTSQRRFQTALATLPAESSEAAQGSAAWMRQEPRPPAMVLRRPGAAPKEPEMSSGERMQGVEASPASSLMHNTRAHGLPPAPALDVNRLTDQVMQTLDRRLTAWRERMGRM